MITSILRLILIKGKSSIQSQASLKSEFNYVNTNRVGLLISGYSSLSMKFIIGTHSIIL